MNCPKCNAPIPPNALFCGECGTPIAQAPEQPAPAVPEQPAPVMPEQPAPAVPEQPAPVMPEQPAPAVPEQPAPYMPEQPAPYTPEPQPAPQPQAPAPEYAPPQNPQYAQYQQPVQYPQNQQPPQYAQYQQPVQYPQNQQPPQYAQYQQPIPYGGSQPQYGGQPPKGSKTPLIIVIIILALLVIGGGVTTAILLINSNNSNNDESSTEPSIIESSAPISEPTTYIEESTEASFVGNNHKVINDNGVEVANDPAIDTTDVSAETKINKALNNAGDDTIRKIVFGSTLVVNTYVRGNTLVYQYTYVKEMTEKQKSEIDIGVKDIPENSVQTLENLRNETGVDDLVIVYVYIDADGKTVYANSVVK